MEAVQGGGVILLELQGHRRDQQGAQGKKLIERTSKVVLGALQGGTHGEICRPYRGRNGPEYTGEMRAHRCGR
jgi:hypothetical protein